MQRKSKWQRVPGAFKRTLDGLGGTRRYRCTGCNKIVSGRPVATCVCGRVWYMRAVPKPRQPISLEKKIERAQRTLNAWMQRASTQQRLLNRANAAVIRAHKRLTRLEAERRGTVQHARGIRIPERAAG